MANLYFAGPNSFMRAEGVFIQFDQPPAYTFTNVPMKDSGPIGAHIGADENWYESPQPGGGLTLDRSFFIGGVPRTSDPNNPDPVVDARNSGWSLTGLNSRDNKNRDVNWRSAYMPHEKQPTTVGVSTSNQFFFCEQMSFTLYDPVEGTVRGTFQAGNVELGLYLPGGYNPNTYARYNPCDEYNGEPCNARDGIIYCGDDEYEPNRPEPDVSLVWYGLQSFLEISNAIATVPDEPNYNFRDFADRDIEYVSGLQGEMISTQTFRPNNMAPQLYWDEYHAAPPYNTKLYSRNMAFYFVPLIAFSNSQSAMKSNAMGSGYRIYKVEMLGRYSNYVVWEDLNSNMIVPKGGAGAAFGFYYSCEVIEFDFSDGSSFRGEFARLAGYLDVDYGFGRLEPYNPCRAQGYAGTCRAANGVVFCGGVQLPPWDGPVGPPTPTPPTPTPPSWTPAPTPVPTPSPTVFDGMTLEWVGNGAFVACTNPLGTLTQSSPDYTFVDDYNSQPTTETDDGRYIARSWEEDGRTRSMKFQAYPRDKQTTNKPRTLSEVKMVDNQGNQLWWLTEAGGFYDNNGANENPIVIPQYYDGFACEYVEFTFRKYNLGSLAHGKFTANDFKYGNYLTGGQTGGQYNLFNPCADGIQPQNQQRFGCQGSNACKCSVVDAQLSCNGIEVNFDMVYEDMFRGGGRVGSKTDQGDSSSKSSGGARLSTGGGMTSIVAAIAIAIATTTLLVGGSVWGDVLV